MVDVTRRSKSVFSGMFVASLKCRGQDFGLVEFALALLQRMQRHRHDEIPLLSAQIRRGFADQQVGKKILKPQRALVFEPVNRLQHDGFGDDGGARRT